MTEKYGYFVDETQDGTNAPGNNRNVPGDIRVTCLEQHKDGHLHVHSAVLLGTGLNPYILSGQIFQ